MIWVIIAWAIITIIFAEIGFWTDFWKNVLLCETTTEAKVISVMMGGLISVVTMIIFLMFWARIGDIIVWASEYTIEIVVVIIIIVILIGLIPLNVRLYNKRNKK